MGKFSGVLLASDFDDTLVPTSALRAQGNQSVGQRSAGQPDEKGI